MAGVTVNNTCSRSTALCTGMPNTLQNQLANCHWRKQCNVTFRNNDTIQCGQHPDVVEKIITFVEIEQPYCIPKGSIPKQGCRDLVNLVLRVNKSVRCC